MIAGLQKATRGHIYFDEEVILGVRPETIQVKDADTSGIEGVVYVEEPLGSDVFLTVQLGDVNVIVRTEPDFRAGIGKRLSLHFHPQKVYFFSPESGSAIY